MTDVTAATIPTIIPVLFELLLTLKSVVKKNSNHEIQNKTYGIIICMYVFRVGYQEKLLWQKLKARNLPVQVCSRSPSRPKTDEFRDNFVSQ
ncbi:hypothetical protein Hanom_Chr02g00171831 [Helianthus anomalus]